MSKRIIHGWPKPSDAARKRPKLKPAVRGYPKPSKDWPPKPKAELEGDQMLGTHMVEIVEDPLSTGTQVFRALALGFILFAFTAAVVALGKGCSS